MNEDQFFKMRGNFRNLMIEKPLAQIIDTLETFEAICRFSYDQKQELIKDLKLMIQYKFATHNVLEAVERLENPLPFTADELMEKLNKMILDEVEKPFDQRLNDFVRGL